MTGIRSSCGKVLIVDDERHVRRLMADRLRAAGCSVIEAIDGEEALELARAERRAAMLLDNRMPGLTGLELCRKLEEQPSTAGIPTIMLTARDFEIGARETAGTDIRIVFGKPFSPGKIVAAILALL